MALRSISSLRSPKYGLSSSVSSLGWLTSSAIAAPPRRTKRVEKSPEKSILRSGRSQSPNLITLVRGRSSNVCASTIKFNQLPQSAAEALPEQQDSAGVYKPRLFIWTTKDTTDANARDSLRCVLCGPSISPIDSHSFRYRPTTTTLPGDYYQCCEEGIAGDRLYRRTTNHRWTC